MGTGYDERVFVVDRLTSGAGALGHCCGVVGVKGVVNECARGRVMIARSAEPGGAEESEAAVGVHPSRQQWSTVVTFQLA